MVSDDSMQVNDIRKMKLVVTAGPTREWMDPVRFISNPSSGKTGYCIAKAGLVFFKQVVYIHGPVAERYQTLEGAHSVAVVTTEDMKEMVHQHVSADTLLVMSAAPVDYRIQNYSSSKIKKLSESMTLTLEPTPDILLSLIELNYPNFIKVGFAAETDSVEIHAEEKLKRKKLDYICANRVHRDEVGFGENQNQIVVIDKNRLQKVIGPLSKQELAEELLLYLIKNIKLRDR